MKGLNRVGQVSAEAQSSVEVGLRSDEWMTDGRKNCAKGGGLVNTHWAGKVNKQEDTNSTH